MDAETYPKLGDLAAKFVLARVDYDGNAELVMKYGVKPLPDVRLLAPDGKELAKFVGRTSPEKLTAAMKAVLEGKPVEVAAGGPKVRAVEATPEAVRKSIARGADFLEAAWKKGWKQDAGLSPDEAALYALAVAGRVPDAALVDRVARAELRGIYQAALQAMALERLDAKRHRDRLEAIARFLLEQQGRAGAWSYGKLAAATDGGDNSNTAYALLGLRACADAGVAVPETAWSAATAWWRKTQNADGGWGYRTDREKESYLSMTESGVSSLALCTSRAGRREVDPRGPAWLDPKFAAEENVGSAYQQGRLIYHLYAAERLAALAGVERLHGRDVWGACASFLLGTQRDDGSWDDGADTPVANTALAILVLGRATRKID